MTEADLRGVRLSDNFSLWEMVRTARADLLERQIELGTVPVMVERAQCLVTDFLQPVRREFGRVDVTIAFRYAEKIDGGWYGVDVATQKHRQGSTTYTAKSQHTTLQAVDFKVPGVDLRAVWEWLKDNARNPFGQLIHEQNRRPDGSISTWLHVSEPGTSLIDGRHIYGEAKDYKSWRASPRYHLIESVDRWPR